MFFFPTVIKRFLYDYTHTSVFSIFYFREEAKQDRYSDKVQISLLVSTCLVNLTQTPLRYQPDDDLRSDVSLYRRKYK